MFGHPAGANGTLDHAWELANIKTVTPSAGWQLYYQSDDGLVPTQGIRLHRLLEDSFREVLTEIWNFARSEVKKKHGFNKTTAFYDDETRKWLHERRLDQHVGGFNFRKITAGSSLSLHAYGIAIDWDAVHNPRKKNGPITLSERWYEIWADHGWIDGRHFSTPDPMHVQFAKGA